MRGSRALRAAGCLVAVGLLVSACAASQEQPENVANVQVHDPDGLAGSVIPEPYEIPAVELQDTAGAPYSLRDDATAPMTLVFFGFTNCPDVCQVVMAEITSALSRLDPAERDDVDVVFVTTDPARDDASTLRTYLDRFDPAYTGLTGDLADIEVVADALKVPFEKGERLPTGGYDVTHGTAVLGVVPGGSAPVLWMQGTGADPLADDLASILADGIPEISEEHS